MDKCDKTMQPKKAYGPGKLYTVETKPAIHYPNNFLYSYQKELYYGYLGGKLVRPILSIKVCEVREFLPFSV